MNASSSGPGSGNSRSLYVDALEGVAIVLVVLGHAIMRTFTEFWTNPVWRLIYAFHMPLFALLCGYVIELRVRRPTAK